MDRYLLLGVFGLFQIALSEEQDSRWRVEGGVVLSHFQQQVKQKVGDERGQRLVNEFQLGD